MCIVGDVDDVDDVVDEDVDEGVVDVDDGEDVDEVFEVEGGRLAGVRVVLVEVVVEVEAEGDAVPRVLLLLLLLLLLSGNRYVYVMISSAYSSSLLAYLLATLTSTGNSLVGRLGLVGVMTVIRLSDVSMIFPGWVSNNTITVDT